jgi:hypothetical protein
MLLAAARRVPGRACVLPPPCVPPVVLNSVPNFGGFVGLLMCLVLLCLTSLMRAVFRSSFASGWGFMVYLLTWVGGVGCPVLNGPVTCVTPVLWGMGTT